MEAARRGYQVIRERAAANRNSRQAAALIRQLVNEGCNWSEIARQLNRNGFHTPNGGQFQAVQAQRLYEREGAA